MESILRAGFIYIFLMIVIRISGHRTLNEMTTFDFILLLIIGDSTQQAITGTDYSVTNAFLVVITLVTLDMLMSFFKQKSPEFEKLIDGMPVILINNGHLEKKILEQLHIDVSDILESSRKLHGLESMDDIKYAILEKSGDITIIPRMK